jgi:hypothetical protein
VELATADRTFLRVFLRVLVRLCLERSGPAWRGEARLGRELEIVDRELAIVLLRVLRHVEERHGKVRTGGDR